LLWVLSGIVNVPLLSRLCWISNHKSITTRFETAKVTVKDSNLLRETPVGSRLCAGKDEHPTRILHSSKRHREPFSKLKNPRNGEQELGSPTSLNDNLEGIDKQAGLRENIGVAILVGELRHNGAPCQIQNRVNLGPREGTQATPMRVSEDICLREGDLKALLVALKPDHRDQGSISRRKDSHWSRGSEHNAGDGGGRSAGSKTRELVDYQEAEGQREWSESKRIKRKPRLRVGEAEGDIKMASSRTANEAINIISNTSETNKVRVPQ
jgi:hypothetical protein